MTTLHLTWVAAVFIVAIVMLITGALVALVDQAPRSRGYEAFVVGWFCTWGVVLAACAFLLWLVRPST